MPPSLVPVVTFIPATLSPRLGPSPGPARASLPPQPTCSGFHPSVPRPGGGDPWAPRTALLRPCPVARGTPGPGHRAPLHPQEGQHRAGPRQPLGSAGFVTGTETAHVSSSLRCWRQQPPCPAQAGTRGSRAVVGSGSSPRGRARLCRCLSPLSAGKLRSRMRGCAMFSPGCRDAVSRSCVAKRCLGVDVQMG